jgi:hypothetical protein
LAELIFFKKSHRAYPFGAGAVKLISSAREAAMIEGFLLGLANGGSCLTYCSPVLLPLFMSSGDGVKGTSWKLTQFLIGRYLGYLIFAVAAWSLRRWIVPSGLMGEMIQAIVQLIMAVLLLYFGIAAPKASCAMEWAGYRWGWRHKIFKFSFSMGFLTGMNLCPPFIALFTGSLLTNGLLSAFWLFSSFFIATSIFFLPFPLLGIFRRNKAIKFVGQMAALLVGGYYFIEALALLGGLLI